MNVAPAHFFDALMPTIDLGLVADRAFLMGSTKSLFAGGIMLTAGFLWRVIGELWNLVRHCDTDFWTPFMHLIFFCAIFASYRPFAVGLVQIVSNLGADMGGGSLVHETFARRQLAFEQYAASLHVPAKLSFPSADEFAALAMQGATHVMYLAVQATAFVIKTTQLFTLATIIAFGPVLLGFASLSPFFHSLGIGWFWALVEVSAWSFTMDVMLYVFDGMGKKIPKDFIFAQEIVICSVVLFGMLSVTQLTAMLIRGQSAGPIGQAPVMMAAGGAFLGVKTAAGYLGKGTYSLVKRIRL